jgi:hypothetical protein
VSAWHAAVCLLASQCPAHSARVGARTLALVRRSSQIDSTAAAGSDRSHRLATALDLAVIVGPQRIRYPRVPWPALQLAARRLQLFVVSFEVARFDYVELA